MTQLDLDRQVAHATGESLRTIAGRGFSLVEPTPQFDPEPDNIGPQIIDWDEHSSDRTLAYASRRRLPGAA
jgi:hypothetical protein